MSFFQNPFMSEFRGNWLLGDRQLSLVFDCPPNSGRGDDLVKSYGVAPFDLSGNDADGDANDEINIRYALDCELFKNWSTITVSLTSATGTISTAVTLYQVAESLNANTTFAAFFSASVHSNSVIVKQKLPSTRFKFYVLNKQGETVLRFNKFAGVAELPTYFARHSMDEEYRFDFADAQNMLVLLDPSGSNVDADVIDNAVDAKGNSKGFDSSDVSEDYELLKGRSGLFTFKKITVDGDDRITEIIEYPAGAVAGYLGKKTTYVYDASNENPSTIKEVPYTITASDLI